MRGCDERAADKAAVKAMHSSFNSIVMDGITRIAEGFLCDTEELHTV